MEPNFPIPFVKMSGTGNDFILIDHREPLLAGVDLAAFARAVCERKFSAGADGLILIEESEEEGVDFRWQFFNGDGSRAEMCGNGARCAARFAHSRAIAPARMRFRTAAGVIEAAIDPETVATGAVRIRLTVPTAIALDEKISITATGPETTVHSVNTGVPHAVLLVENVAAAPVVEWGRAIRFHDRFQPAGTNVNFVRLLGPDRLRVRTYERGVEDETMACGTGAVAAALVAALLGLVKSPVRVVTSGHEELTIHFTMGGASGREIDAVYLEGPANFIYEGRLHREALRGMGKDRLTAIG